MKDDELVMEDPPILIPPGEYDVKVVSTKRLRKFDRPMLRMRFQIVSLDQFNGTKLEAWLPLGEGGRVSGNSKLGRWYLVLGLPGRKDRVQLKAFRVRLLRASVRTVERDHRQRPLHPSAQYSVVDGLLGTVAMLADNAEEALS